MYKHLLTLCLGLIVGAFAVAALPATIYADDGSDHSEETSEQQPAAEEQEPAEEAAAEETSDKTYRYSAKAGDSYSVLVRKAVQTYGIESSTNLSGAQIVYIETSLTQAAGSPLLEVGQDVEITEASVKEWVEKAKNLDTDTLAAWDYYVQFVDFNTDANG